MKRDHHFILTGHSSECFSDYVKKSFTIDIFSPHKSGIISINLEIRLLPEEEIEIKDIRLNHHNFRHQSESDVFFIGCFGFQDVLNFHSSVRSLGDVLQDSNVTPSYGSGLWREFADQFKDWFNAHIRSHLIAESKIALRYFKD